MLTRSFKVRDLTVPVVATVAAVLGVGVAAPSVSYAQNDRQKDKNLMRNIAIGAAAGAIYSGVKGNKTAAIALGAGAVYAGKKYEDARKAQNRENDRPQFSYDYPRYENSRFPSDNRRRDDYRYDDEPRGDYRYDNGRRDPREIRYKGNNGKHKGWSKNKKKCDDD